MRRRSSTSPSFSDVATRSGCTVRSLTPRLSALPSSFGRAAARVGGMRGDRMSGELWLRLSIHRLPIRNAKTPPCDWRHRMSRIAAILLALFLAGCGDPRERAIERLRSVGAEQLRKDAAFVYKRAFAGHSVGFIQIRPKEW